MLSIIDTAWVAGERYFKSRGLSLALLAIRGLRRALIALFAALIACIALTASFFSALIYNLENESFQLDVFNIVSLSIATLSLGTILWALRERTWIAAFDVKRRLAEVVRESEAQAASPTSQVSEAVIEEAVRETLRRLAA